MKNKLIILTLILLSFQLWAEDISKYTNKNEINLKGFSDPNVIVTIYVNDREVKTVNSDASGNWFAQSIFLNKDGLNSVYAIASAEDGSKSKLSIRLNVMVDKIPPKVYVFSAEPLKLQPGETLKISLRTDKDTVSVPVMMPDNSILNLTQSSKNDGTWTGQWVVPRLMSGGTYQIIAMATDQAGNVNQQRSEDIIIDAQASLVVTSPEEGQLTYDSLIVVKGMARNSEYVLVNDDRVAVDPDSTFSGFAKLEQPGRNLITIKSYNPNGMLMEKDINLTRLITFRDIKTHWAKPAIEYLATLGYVQAYPQTDIFAPDNNISRAELAALLVRTKQYPLSGGSYLKPSFTDVKDNYWAIGYIEAAAKYGLIEGYPGQVYKPQSLVSRAEAVAMLVRFANIPVMKVERTGDLDVGTKHWASSYIAAFKSAGLMPPEWRNVQRFFPNKAITRAEVCAILARVAEINREIELMLDRKTNWDYAIDNSYYLKQNATQTDSVPPSCNLAAAPQQNGGALIVGIVAPKEVMKGNDLNLTVAALAKMKAITAVFPDTSRLPLTFNSNTDVWEINWKTPKDIRPGDYQLTVEAVDQGDQKYVVQSNKFTVYGDEEVQTASKIGIKETAEFTYPEYRELEQVPPAGTDEPLAGTDKFSSEISQDVLTRGKMTAILAKYKILRRAKVSIAPAKDVPLNHPYVQTIKSAIVTGMVSNINGRFYPDKAVTKTEAVQVLKRAKVSIKSAGSADLISETEFDNWLKKSVK
jgi:hypothetical protein